MSSVTVLKYADDTYLIRCTANPLDLSNHFHAINRVANQCADLGLLLNANETKEMTSSTQRNKPDSPPLTLTKLRLIFVIRLK